MFQRAILFLLIACLMNAAGIPRSGLQVAAWTRMTATYSKSEKLGVAIQKTFDGKNPCGLCLKLRKISNPSHTIGTEPTQTIAVNLELGAPYATPSLMRPTSSRVMIGHSTIHLDSVNIPDSPPPELTA